MMVSAALDFCSVSAPSNIHLLIKRLLHQLTTVKRWQHSRTETQQSRDRLNTDLVKVFYSYKCHIWYEYISKCVFCFSEAAFDNPGTVGRRIRSNEETLYVNRAYGLNWFLPLERMRRRDFLKGGTAVFLFSLEGLHLFPLNYFCDGVYLLHHNITILEVGKNFVSSYSDL